MQELVVQSWRQAQGELLHQGGSLWWQGWDLLRLGERNHLPCSSRSSSVCSRQLRVYLAGFQTTAKSECGSLRSFTSCECQPTRPPRTKLLHGKKNHSWSCSSSCNLGFSLSCFHCYANTSTSLESKQKYYWSSSPKLKWNRNPVTEKIKSTLNFKGQDLRAVSVEEQKVGAQVSREVFMMQV